MKPSFFSPGGGKQISQKAGAFLLVFVMFFSILAPIKAARAQMIVNDPIQTVKNIASFIWEKTTTVADKLWKKAGSVALHQTLRSALNKIAYDTATAVASGGRGQQPLFVTKDWGEYLKNIVDEAGGDFVESFANNLARSNAIEASCQAEYQTCTSKCDEIKGDEIGDEAFFQCFDSCKDVASKCSQKKAASSTDTTANAYLSSFNVCQPSSVEAKLKISLGLVEQQRPGSPNCTASEMISDWGDAGLDAIDWARRLEDYSQDDFINDFSGIFDPTANDLGIALIANTDMIANKAGKQNDAELKLATNKGWKDLTDAAGKLVGIPGDAERKVDFTTQTFGEGMLTMTEDLSVDALNIFLNQASLVAFNNLMGKLGEKVSKDSSQVTNIEATGNDTGDKIEYGEGSLKYSISRILKPSFSTHSDYDILTSLSVCSDPKNPGPTDCVVDSRFVQAVSEKKTVIEAIQEGYINGDWQLAVETKDNAYSLRNVSILRKYRILPVGWEEAIKRAAASSTKVTVMDMVSCYEENDGFENFSASFDGKNQSWCRGLVDPYWVLKAPLNSCAKEGFGAQILNVSVVPGTNYGSEYTPSSLSLTRADSYCADEKTCIKEKDDGSCEAYGYCNEESRTWKLEGDSCDPVFNTCQSFVNSNTGASVSYLENTLDYGDCDANSVGCRRYALGGTYNEQSGLVDWAASAKQIYFNQSAPSCTATNEGCNELLRVKETWGSNLVIDSAFELDSIGDIADDGYSLNLWNPYFSSNTANGRLAIVDSASDPADGSGRALKVSAIRSSGGISIDGGVYSDGNHSLLPDNFQVQPGVSYTLSADVFIAAADAAYLYLGPQEDGYRARTTVSGSWQHLTITRLAGASFVSPEFSIVFEENGNSLAGYIKNVKFEISTYDTGFSTYGSFRVFQKLLPNYLEEACYRDVTSATKDYTLRDDAPAICSTFARKCNKSEVGCEAFTGLVDGLTVNAQVSNTDYCREECVGYDSYISKESYFNSSQQENLIPTKATACSAAGAGCREFTNLDAVEQGGESREYYSSLRQCLKPSEASCSSFYSWEGTEGGYQFRSYSLKRAADGSPAVVSENESAACTQEIYSKHLGEIGYNADCYAFLDSSGNTYYRLLSQTITCSEDCHPYRLSGDNIDLTLNSEAACAAGGASNHWDEANGVCHSCLNGGRFDEGYQACVYQAIPGEGDVCSASEVGCREYNGNSGNNIKVIATADFENGYSNWSSNCSGGLKYSTIANNNGGHSLQYVNSASACGDIGAKSDSGISLRSLVKSVFASDNNGAQLSVGQTVSEDKAYTLRFIARASNNVSFKAYFYNPATKKAAYFNTTGQTIAGGGDWKIYQVNLPILDHEVSSSEVLVLSANGDFYFDDLVLTEIGDRYYLIQGSSVIPDSCQYDIFDVYQGADYNLGCAQYSDRDGLIHNLHRFSRLCSSSSVGCEQLISTANYSSPLSEIWNDTNNNGICESGETDCVAVPADHAIYAMYDKSKACSSSGIGCSRLGQNTPDGSGWSDVYKQNNPNLYGSILCGAGDIACDAWQGGDGSISYFKDPGNNVCQYRRSNNPAISTKAWYKIPVKRCDYNNNGNIDASEQNGLTCASAATCGSGSCIVDNTDYPCTTDSFKTFGLGGSGNQVFTPNQAAAMCDQAASGCTEYIDPISRFSANIVANPSYESVDGSVSGWSGNSQNISLEPNKLYILTVTGGSSVTSLSFPYGVRQFLGDNSLSTNSVTTLSIPAGSGSIMFASLSNSSATINGGQSGKSISLKPALISYQLSSGVDLASCNGALNFSNGCVLMNKRSAARDGWASLPYNAAVSKEKSAPTACSNGNNCTANVLVKATPNRVCSKWLDCLTYVTDPSTGQRTCYAVGQCTRLDDKNECANFEDVPVATVDHSSSQDAAGYQLLGRYPLAAMSEVGLNTDAHYDFEDASPALTCKKAGADCSFSKGSLAADLLINEPEKSPVTYPAHGQVFLRVPSSYVVSPHSENTVIRVRANTTYYLNFLVNSGKSGLGAKATIKSADNKEIASSVSYPGDSWTRKIVSFSTGNNTAVKIELSGADATKDGSVYFDDINIEPVLKTGADQYVARECRLYPSDESLTCSNKNENVTQNGLEGYCLEHDADNPGVCQLWYPVDNISSSNLIKTSAGYSGAYPLNYCTEVNGNFDIVERRKPFYLGGSSAWRDGDNCSDVTNGEWSETMLGKSASRGFYTASSSLFDNGCGSDYFGFVFRYHYLDSSQKNNDRCALDYWCIPKQGTMSVVAEFRSSGNPFSTTNTYIISQEGGVGSFSYSSSGSNIFPVNATVEDYVEGTARPDENNGELQPRIHVISGSGWYRYNGISSNNMESELIEDQPIRIYDYKNPPTVENDLKLLSGSGDDVYELTCNSFTQVVDGSGENYAWASRTGINSSWATSTPNYFVDFNKFGTRFYGNYTSGSLASQHKLAGYGYNRATTPFGAATFPDDFSLANSEPVKLRNQWSIKNGETIFAGRPYGCSNYRGENGNGCYSIGSCSLNPDVYCLVGNSSSTDFVSKKTCSDGGFGACLPLWSSYPGFKSLSDEPINVDFQQIIQTLFLKTYSMYNFDGDSYSPVKGAFDKVEGIGRCANNVRPAINDITTASSSFCYVQPTVDNVVMKTADGSKIIFQNIRGAIPQKGVYRLEFTSTVDAEQQPLKEIYIDWGDGSSQAIKGQDNHPDKNDPHVFYHYYKKPVAPASDDDPLLNIRVSDNWNKSN